ncbi:double-strand break repair protein AddB [Mesorhizobium sp. CGMCC 1.15528]|uniref:Double-strand break repair protein AddB n=1 Tax=Mesorhizobium zhangyense TaxID=1776730 RepID=A0A7C9VF07_9HYPH|nr:double-strand break repair protein AddB [Mesorhizobium zhangyense]NGN43769.1 double-strand break repair protein AddB [Mesorhizobium zhangyense]
MSARSTPRVLSIPPGAAFLPTLADELLAGRLIPDFRFDGDPLALADVTIYVPTRRAARELRGVFVDSSGGRAAILPTIRPLGEFDEDEALFNPEGSASLDLAPPIASIDRLLLLAPLVRSWKRRLPAHVASLFEEEIVVPASSADAVWLARDLAGLMDEIETEGSEWSRLRDLVSGDLANWWQVTLDFLEIVMTSWPAVLAERDLSNPAAHRSALIRLEAERLRLDPPQGPIIAAGSTGSIPATAELLSAIARLPRGAVVLPGLDKRMDERSWSVIAGDAPQPSVLGHPQYGLAKLLRKLGVLRADVDEVGAVGPDLAQRAAFVGQALLPAETTDDWADHRQKISDSELAGAFADVTLLEAAGERDETVAIAIALRRAIDTANSTAALVTGDRNLARRVSAELLRFGIQADDSGGTPLSNTPPGAFLRLVLQAAFNPGDPVAVLSLLKHPLLALGLERAVVRHAAETIELVALRGGTGRPDIASLGALFEKRLEALAGESRKPFWFSRMTARPIDEARAMLARLHDALAPLVAFRNDQTVELAAIIHVTVTAMEALGRSADGSLTELYAGDAGEELAELLRGLVAASAPFSFPAEEWPDIMEALVAPEVVKPAYGSDSRVSIWGALEARLLSVDTLVVGGLNEGVWPRKAQADRFMSRIMKTGIDLEPPERRIGQSAHDFEMAMGAGKVILARSARSGDAPAVPSRWLQRILTFAGVEQAQAMRARGNELLGWARALDGGPQIPFAERPQPKPPLEARPHHFSVTEIETLRRDPYAVYARRILGLMPLDPLVRDPGAAERGTLFHAIMHRFSASGVDPRDASALDVLLDAGRTCFTEAALPADVHAIWWPRFEKLAENIIAWERTRAPSVNTRHAEERAEKTAVGASAVTLSGYADRVDVLPAGMADILDYKTGSSPSKAQAHTLLAPQLALEGALLRRGAFRELGRLEPSQLAFVRFKPNGEVFEESILEYNRKPRTAGDLSEEAWHRLEELLKHYGRLETGYLSRALPFREGETDGDYDHLARVLEWSAGGDSADDGGGDA